MGNVVSSFTEVFSDNAQPVFHYFLAHLEVFLVYNYIYFDC